MLEREREKRNIFNIHKRHVIDNQIQIKIQIQSIIIHTVADDFLSFSIDFSMHGGGVAPTEYNIRFRCPILFISSTACNSISQMRLMRSMSVYKCFLQMFSNENKQQLK